jgi:hypothetical protein
MNGRIRKLLIPLVGISVAVPNLAAAVCLDPKSGVSGYRVPFQDELNASIAVVVGEVVSERKVFETPEDPAYYSVIYTVRTEQVLKGRPLKIFRLREELDTGRYPLSVGEKHLLFITHWKWKVRGADYVIDACGNSSRLPEGDQVVAVVQRALNVSAHAP